MRIRHCRPIVVCDASDRSALWAYEGLRGLGLDDLDLVPSGVLDASLRTVYRVSGPHSRLKIELVDGRVLANDSIGVVLNRHRVGVPESTDPADFEYAASEARALFVAWAASLPSVILNRPVGASLAGRSRSLPEWMVLAAQAGLATVDIRWRSNATRPSIEETLAEPQSVIVVQGDVVADLPRAVKNGCRRLYEQTATELFGVRFVRTTAKQWLFAGVDLVPDLRQGGQPILDRLALVMTR